MKLILTLLLILTLSYACKKKDDNRVRQPVTENMLKTIPYQNGQIVAFSTNKSGTISTVVERKLQVFKPTSPLVSEDILEVNLIISANNTKFISFLARGSGITADTVAQFDISPYGDFYNIIQFVTHDNGRMNSFLFNGKSIFLDRYITSTGNVYYNVLELFWDNRDNPRYINKLYYNKEKGVIRFETGDGLIGSLI